MRSTLHYTVYSNEIDSWSWEIAANVYREVRYVTLYTHTRLIAGVKKTLITVLQNHSVAANVYREVRYITLYTHSRLIAGVEKR